MPFAIANVAQHCGVTDITAAAAWRVQLTLRYSASVVSPDRDPDIIRFRMVLLLCICFHAFTRARGGSAQRRGAQ